MKSTITNWIWSLLLIALLLSSCGGSDETPTPATELTREPQSGGMALPAATTPAPAATPTATEVAMVIYQTGEEVKAIGAAPLRVYAGASVQTPVMAQYGVGEVFTITEPSARYAATYPVQVDGSDWYRVRGQDGLVGWVQAEFVTPVQ